MTIRIIVRVIDYANIDTGHASYKTFDIEDAALEAALRREGYEYRQHVAVFGAELVGASGQSQEGGK